MKFNSVRSNVVYERRFARPMFSVPRVSVEILESFYRALSPEYVISMADLSASPATAMSDIAVRATLFGGNGLLEVNAERFHAAFTNIQTSADIQTVKNVLTLGEAALAKVLESAEFTDTIIRISAWLALSGGNDDAEQFFKTYRQTHISVEDIGAERAIYPTVGNFTNDAQGWRLNLMIEPSTLTGAQLFFQADATYTQGGQAQAFEQKVAHMETTCSVFLAKHGLEREQA